MKYNCIRVFLQFPVEKVNGNYDFYIFVFSCVNISRDEFYLELMVNYERKNKVDYSENIPGENMG